MQKTVALANQVISVVHANENNLRSISLDIPKNQLVVVTGVSGSGKSSLIFDVIYREAERRYLSTFTAYARQFLQRTKRPDVERITGLSPAIAIDQHAITRNPRSTVGTLTEIYDYLRLLYARTGGQADGRTGGQADRRTGGQADRRTGGQADRRTGGQADGRTGGQAEQSVILYPVSRIPHPGSRIAYPVSRSLFSFNSPEGACPVCKGLGVEDSLNPELLIADPTKSIREGALVITAPNGYIIYSQVTLDVLNQVCEAEGFTIDIPWQEMTDKQKQVILFGSDKIEVPFGKHNLESRMRWSGITAKPREMGYYKGIIPIMETILNRERNKNILRFVRSKTCHACQGKRLKPEALAVTIHQLNIADLNAMPLNQLKTTLTSWHFSGNMEKVATPILEALFRRIHTLESLGLDYLSCNRESTTLSAGESQRIRLSVQLENTLQGLLYIFDEPSVGLHPADTLKIINALKKLRDKGNSVIVVEHEEAFIRHADHLIDIGPGAGTNGGEVLVNCPVTELNSLSEETIAKSATLQYLYGRTGGQADGRTGGQADRRTGGQADGRTGGRADNVGPQDFTAFLKANSQQPAANSQQPAAIFGASLHNLKNIDVAFVLHALNVVTGVSGAGKSSLVNGIIGQRLPGSYREMKGWEEIRKTITIDQAPIGKSSRSNPATYTGLFDLIRDHFADLPEAVAKGYGKSRFSFNTKGGRCPDCEGAGYHQIGMHFMGMVEVVCETCQGKQFDEETLSVKSNGKSIADVLNMTITEALTFFAGFPKILHYLQVMDKLGLGYLHLGQRSSTLSGGEAQRIKLATELARPASGHTLYLLDEPTAGLHNADVALLSEALQSLVANGHTVILIEHHPALILSAGHVVDLGPGSGTEGGRVVTSGTPQEIINTPNSLTGQALLEYLHPVSRNPDPVSRIPDPGSRIPDPVSRIPHPASRISCQGLSTNNLQNISCEIPHNKITVITGISGSGKSSLAFDTIVAEGQNRFLGSFSAYARSMIGLRENPVAEEITGLTPIFAVDQRNPGHNPRSTVGTYTGIYDILRLLYARTGGQADGRTSGQADGRTGGQADGRTGGQADGRTSGQADQSVIPDPASRIPYPVSRIPYPVSRIPYPASRIPHPGSRIPDPVSSLFSFNDTQGACPVCKGLGTILTCDPQKLITHPVKPVTSGAMEGTKTGRFYGEPFGQYISTLKAVGERHGFDYTKPWNHLPEVARKLAMEGTGEEIYDVVWKFKRGERTGEHRFRGKWTGFRGLVDDEYKRKHADHRGEEMKAILRRVNCEACGGTRLNPLALSYTIAGYTIADVTRMPVDQVIDHCHNLEASLPPGKQEAAHLLLEEIRHRLQVMEETGLGYLTLERPVEVLSGGEFQRVKLAGQMVSGLTGITYVLDEPTAGLHPSDTHLLTTKLKQLRNDGNTVIVVEHDPDVIREADLVIDMGPGAGSEGGTIIATGSPEELSRNPGSVTGPLLRGNYPVINTTNHTLRNGITITGASIPSLPTMNVELPLGGIIAITGRSGSGKSTLLRDVILASLEAGEPRGCEGISGLTNVGKVIPVWQKRQIDDNRGTPVTYTGLMDPIRDLFASTDAAREYQFRKSHFSFLTPDGRCPACNGAGEIRVSMDFLSDVRIPCETCKGTRFNTQILGCTIEGKNIAEVLNLTFRESALFFAGNKKLQSPLERITEVGLGYLKLGQPLHTLSGGEVQRLSLVREVLHPSGANQLFLFEEPSAGLHANDLPALVNLFETLISNGHSVLMTENHPMLTGHADHIIPCC